MASENSNSTRSPMYPKIIDSNYEHIPHSSSSGSNLYPTVDMEDVVKNLFPDYHLDSTSAPSAPPESTEEILLTIRGAILHLIDKQYSVELATGDLLILRICQDENTVAVLARIDDTTQWPLTKDLASVKLDQSHYFFAFPAPKESDSGSSSGEDETSEKKTKKTASENDYLEVLSYGLTVASKGQECLLKELDVILGTYCNFQVHRVEEKVATVLGGGVASEVTPADLGVEKKREILEERCAAYWTTLAPNVEEYSSSAARMVAMGSGRLIKGILWCGDVTSDRLKWGNEILKKRMTTGSKAEIDPQTLKRIKRVKRVTKMTEKVATGVLSGVVKVSGFFTSSIANSKAGKKFFGLLPGELVLASLDGFSKICDAVEVAGKNVMSTSSTVTTGLVTHRYGEEAAKATSEGLDAAGHAMGTAWAVFKIRKAFNPKSVLKPSALAKSAAKSAAAEKKAKSSK